MSGLLKVVVYSHSVYAFIVHTAGRKVLGNPSLVRILLRRRSYFMQRARGLVFLVTDATPQLFATI